MKCDIGLIHNRNSTFDRSIRSVVVSMGGVERKKMIQKSRATRIKNNYIIVAYQRGIIYKINRDNDKLKHSVTK